jgi:hypothetical protein
MGAPLFDDAAVRGRPAPLRDFQGGTAFRWLQLPIRAAFASASIQETRKVERSHRCFPR